MSSKELAPSPENFNWEPSLVVRAHHLNPYLESDQSFRGNPISILVALVKIAIVEARHPGAYKTDDASYEADAPGGTNRILEANQTLEGKIKTLPDTAVVQIGLLKDGICYACAVGKHCDATNFRLGHHLRFDAVKEEIKEVERFRRKLAERFLEGVDFKLVPTTRIFLDYRGQSL